MDTRTVMKPAATDPDDQQGKPAAQTRAAFLPLKKTVLILAAVMVAAALAWRLLAPPPLPMELATASTGPMQVSVGNQGQVRIHDKYVLAAPLAARLQRIAVDDGDPVHRGQALVFLYPLPMDARQREQAQAKLEAARALARDAGLRARRAASDLQLASAERTRTESLVAERFISAQAMEKVRAAESAGRAEFQAAQAREQAAQADVRAAEAALIAVDVTGSNSNSNSSQQALALTSPVDGYVLKVMEKSERTVASGTPLVSVGNPEQYEIVVDVLSTDAVKVRAGQTMWLDDWGGNQSLRATVRLVEPVAFTKISALGVEEQRVNVIAQPVDLLGPLGDGYRIEARIVIAESDNVLKVPGSSVFRVGDRWHLFTVAEGRAHERDVTLGMRNQDEVEVLSGVAAGTQVIRFPNNQLKEGMRVQALR